VGVRVYGNIVTRNLGNAQAQNSTTGYYIDGAIVNSAYVPALAAGGSDTEAASFICERAGSHTFSASADAGGNVTEKNETNNGSPWRSAAPDKRQAEGKALKWLASISSLLNIT